MVSGGVECSIHHSCTLEQNVHVFYCEEGSGLLFIGTHHGLSHHGRTQSEEVKPSLTFITSDRLAAKKRFRTQRRLSTMKNKVLRNAQWVSLKKEKRKVEYFN